MTQVRHSALGLLIRSLTVSLSLANFLLFYLWAYSKAEKHIFKSLHFKYIIFLCLKTNWLRGKNSRRTAEDAKTHAAAVQGRQ